MHAARLAFIFLVIALGASCGSSTPTAPTSAATRSPALSRTRFLAFGDSFTAGEITDAATGQAGSITKLIVVPSASYPAVLQNRLRATYTSQAALIGVTNAGEPGERILDGLQRFPGAYDPVRPDVVLIQEGVNGLPLVGPDTSAGVMRLMVQHAKAGGSRVFVGSMIPQVAGRPRGTTPTTELVAYNTTLRLMSEQEAVVFVDLYTPMLPEAATLVGSDGLHPSELGYARIAELFLAAIRRELEQ